MRFRVKTTGLVGALQGFAGFDVYHLMMRALSKLSNYRVDSGPSISMVPNSDSEDSSVLMGTGTLGVIKSETPSMLSILSM